ncbi:MAG: hypothetical protein D6816_19225 [Bacteroidetes bacterium]|nr:MAG: hypothetical protein D6816_19225 [Bacteroidota bacterium]
MFTLAAFADTPSLHATKVPGARLRVVSLRACGPIFRACVGKVPIKSNDNPGFTHIFRHF